MDEGDKLEQIGHAMMLAWGRIKRAEARMWGDWMTIGEGLLEGRRWAMHVSGVSKTHNLPQGRGYVTAFAEWLKRFKVNDMDKSDRAKLLQLMEERAAVEEWRATLSDHDRRTFNHPTIVWRKWMAATRVKKKPKPATAANAESRRAAEQLQERVAELEEELAAAREIETGISTDLDAARRCTEARGGLLAEILDAWAGIPAPIKARIEQELGP